MPLLELSDSPFQLFIQISIEFRICQGVKASEVMFVVMVTFIKIKNHSLVHILEQKIPKELTADRHALGLG